MMYKIKVSNYITNYVVKYVGPIICADSYLYLFSIYSVKQLQGTMKLIAKIP